VANGDVKALGIVDPFVTAPIQPGQWFWLVVFPRQIKSLRHVWTHPDFPESPDLVAIDQKNELEDLKAQQEFEDVKKVSESEAWLRHFLHDVADLPYDEVIAAVLGEPLDDEDGEGLSVRNDGEYLTIYGLDAGGSIPEEFWDHLEIVTGKKITRRAQYFSCSC
jgi:hypothetical protein